MWSRGISLANKCQLLFGAAVVLIISAALVWPWLRQISVLDDAQLETSRQIAELWADSPLIDPAVAAVFRPADTSENPGDQRKMVIRWWPIADWRKAAFPAGFLERAKQHLAAPPRDAAAPASEHVESGWDPAAPTLRLYRYARLVLGADSTPQGVVVLERRSPTVRRALLENQGFLIGAGVFAGSLAMIVFYLITTKIILHPVRALRETAERVRAGNTSVRSDLKTGDEFEHLAGAFNSMLSNLEEQQTLLRGINKSLDLRLNELAERNTALYDAARLKGEFLANVSHELRTPLNSIIGFAEILQDLANADAEQPGTDPDKVAKRRRYLDNIVGAGRTLLEMINDLLAMAKIEAGKIEVQVQEVNVGETCEALTALIRPLADRKNQRITLQLQAGPAFVADARAADLPLILTDQQKFQQILFNFLSNAVKFTPERGDITLRAERLTGTDGVARLRVSVLDTGPGIPATQHRFIFEKFSQIDAGHTRRHQGTGLGLAISKEFAELLQAEIQLVSEPGRGSMFSLILPPAIDLARTQTVKQGLVERAATAGRLQRA